ncbi:MAG: ATP-binding protein [Oxalobacter sp.]|nr:ATP-binding protein [Oxalobacter sp.]
MQEIQRDRYLEKLIRRKGNRQIKVVTGLRRCGKSYLLMNLFHRHLIESRVEPSHIIEIALDDRVFKELRNPDAMLSAIRKRIADNGQYYIILDEVQMMDEFEDVLNSLLHIQNADVYVTGSNSKFLSSDIITRFRGRGDPIHVHPLSFKEFVSVYDGSLDEAWDDYMTYGGMPQVLDYTLPDDKADYLQRLMQQVYLRDLAERYRLRNDQEFEELLDILASSIGSLTNPTKLSATFKSVKQKTVSDKTISSWLKCLEDVFLIHHAKRYDVKGKKYINTPLKYYFEDLGLRNARVNFRQQEESHLMENAIYNELRMRGFQVDVGIVPIMEKETKGTVIRKQVEVDFVAGKGNRRIYIQSAMQMPDAEKMKQEKRPFLHIKDAFQRMIVVRNNIKPRIDENGIITMGLPNFLLSEDDWAF